MIKEINIKQRICRTILLILCCAVFGSCAKKEHEVYRIGIVSGADVFIEMADGFKAKMNELGYIEGKNVVYDLQKTNADHAAVKRAVGKFVTDKVDLIFAFPTEPAIAAKNAVNGTDIPMVFAMAGIEENKLVDSVTVPGGNITGVRFPGPEITAKRLEILCELMPQAKRIYLIYDPNYPTAPTAIDNLNRLAQSLKLTLVEDTVNNLKELQEALNARAALKDIGIDAIFIMPEILTQSPEGWAKIIEFANEHKLPVAGGIAYTTKYGAIFSVAPNNIEVGVLSASLADKILKGSPAGKIMVITPPIRLWLNYKLAAELGLNVPEGLLNRADEIIR